MTRIVLLALTMCLPGLAQMRLTVDQLVQFIRSSIQLKHEDRRVAEYLKKVQLSEKLDERGIEELQGLGAGPKTVQALRALSEASAALPAPPPPPVKQVIASIPAPTPAEQERVLKAVREYALNYVRRLPDFICTQVTRRYVDPTGLEFWQREDVITEQLSYFERREEYKVVLVNSVPSSLSHDQVGGATSSGEFGTMLKEIFEPESRGDFRWERWTTLRGKRMHVFAYRVSQPYSKLRISFQRTQEIIAGYRGSVFVDRDTLAVMRVAYEAENLPPSFPIQQASTVLDYDNTDIAGLEFVLPLRAVVRLRTGKFLTKNEVEFRMYRKFTTEAVISAIEPEPLPPEKTQEQPAKPQQ
jgi:hypothetical protein